MILGKFMPPHLGHVYLAEFARAYVDELTIVVGSLAAEPIPGALRHAWMRELIPDACTVHLTDENPQDPSEHPDFWRIWEESLRRVLPSQPDYVFASESYGAKLAEVLGAEFVPVDLARGVMPVSGTAVRTDPLGQWRYLPRCVRPYFVRRVCVFGPESTGKTTLAKRLADAFDTVMVPEYARLHLERKAAPVTADDMPKIARGQIASEEALARSANRVLICDTDVLSTAIWSDVLFGACAASIAAEADRRTYDLYVLTEPDVPWVGDAVRYLPNGGADFHARCERELTQRRRPFVKVRGTWDERFAIARDAIEAMMKAPRVADLPAAAPRG
jgi:NadR type nicotinamide-nucleotide adenylyltransferase